MPNAVAIQIQTPEFPLGTSVLVTGTIPHAGECGTILGFMRHVDPILYVVLFDNGAYWARVPNKNLIGPLTL